MAILLSVLIASTLTKLLKASRHVTAPLLPSQVSFAAISLAWPSFPRPGCPAVFRNNVLAALYPYPIGTYVTNVSTSNSH